MKFLFLILSLISLQCFAGNWMGHATLKSDGVEAYQLESDCLKKYQSCYDIGENSPSVYSEVFKDADDYTKPKYLKADTGSCLNAQDCQNAFLALECSEGYSPIKNLDLMEVYCVKFNGYEQKQVSVMELDSGKVQAKAAQDAIKAQLAVKEAAINKAIKDIEFGKRIVALVRLSSVSKGLTDQQTEQIESSMSEILKKLDLGKIPQAKTLIEAVQPDGVLITSADKSSVLAEINAYLNL